MPFNCRENSNYTRLLSICQLCWVKDVKREYFPYHRFLAWKECKLIFHGTTESPRKIFSLFSSWGSEGIKGLRVDVNFFSKFLTFYKDFSLLLKHQILIEINFLANLTTFLLTNRKIFSKIRDFLLTIHHCYLFPCTYTSPFFHFPSTTFKYLPIRMRKWIFKSLISISFVWMFEKSIMLKGFMSVISF